MNPTLTVIFIGLVVCFGCLIMVFSNMTSKPQKRMRHRIDSIHKRANGLAVKGWDEGNKNNVKKEISGRFQWIEKLARQLLPRQEVLETRLARTGRDISIGSYVLANVITVAVVFIIVVFALRQSVALGMMISVIGGVGLPHLFVGRMANKRLKLFTEQFPDAIDLIVRGLKSGLPVTESISSVGQEMADPVGYEFRHISDCVKMGQPIEEALWDTAKRLDTPEFKFFVISISVQRETGGNLSEALGNLSEILRRRRQMGLKIKAMSSEAKASAIILGSLPFIMFGIIFAMNPDYEMVLFNDPRGQTMLGVGLGIMTMGVLVMNKMIKFEV